MRGSEQPDHRDTIEREQSGTAGGLSLCLRHFFGAIQSRSYVMSDNMYYVKKQNAGYLFPPPVAQLKPS
jgi:hypothetical protein